MPVYYAVLGTLALYGLHRLVLLLALRLARPPAAGGDGGADLADLQDSAARDAEWPLVTVQLPIYNERYVAPRLIAAVLDFDYPADRLEIQILDDSTDDTADRVEAALARASKRKGRCLSSATSGARTAAASRRALSPPAWSRPGAS